MSKLIIKSLYPTPLLIEILGLLDAIHRLKIETAPKEKAVAAAVG